MPAASIASTTIGDSPATCSTEHIHCCLLVTTKTLLSRLLKTRFFSRSHSKISTLHFSMLVGKSGCSGEPAFSVSPRKWHADGAKTERDIDANLEL